MYYLYILECSNGNYYTGITTDLERRWQQHLDGSAAKYTRAFPPKAMVAHWQVNEDRGVAQSLEKSIKQLSRAEKEALIRDPGLLGQ